MADTTCTEEFNIVSAASRQATAERRAAREAEIIRLGKQIARAKGGLKYKLVSELLAFLGVIHNTPEARHTWESQ